jgi:diaminopimelate decarboxylase
MSTSDNLHAAHPSPLTNELAVTIAKTYGTPTYVYFQETLERQYNTLAEALRNIPAQIFFAVKASSNLQLLKIFRSLGAGFDIVSQGELMRVLASGGEASDAVFAGVGKTREEIAFAIEKEIKFFNIESIEELQCIQEVASTLKKKANISFRVNPDVNVETHPYLATGLKSSKFGIPIPEIASLWEAIKNDPFLNLTALDCHIGSQISDIEPYRDAFQALISLARELETKGANITYLDFGGGLGVHFTGHYTPLNLQAYGTMIRKLIEGTSYRVIVEPGKFLVSEAGFLLTSVVYTKKNHEKHFIVVDAGMNDLIRPSLYDAYHYISTIPVNPSAHHSDTVVSVQQPHIRGSREGEKRSLLEVNEHFRPTDNKVDGADKRLQTVIADIVGPVCETGCFFARDREIPATASGDLIVVHDAGAYGITMASNYNTRRIPAEVLVQTDNTIRIIKKRQSYEDVYKDEL